jgi:hypothetical protein
MYLTNNDYYPPSEGGVTGSNPVGRANVFNDLAIQQDHQKPLWVDFRVELEIKAAIKIHGPDAVFTAAAAGECEDFEPLRAMGLDVSTIREAEQISLSVYRQMSTEEKISLYWEANQDLYKPTTRMPEGLPTDREEQIALIESWLKMERLRVARS